MKYCICRRYLWYVDFWGENYTVSDIISAILLGMYASWYLSCSIDGPIYQPSSPCGSHDEQSVGLFWMTILVPGGANGVRLKSNSPNMCVYYERWGIVLDCLRNLDLLFPDVIVCPTIEIESLYLCCTFPLWVSFWRFNFFSLYCFFCDYLGGLADTWCLW